MVAVFVVGALAVAEGFEPSDGFSRHTLSRRAP